jgi:hypothetical protein
VKRILLFFSCSWLLLGGPIVQWTTAENPDANGHYYEFISAPAGITWSDASAGATALGGYLVTITSADENDFVFSLVDNSVDYVQGVTGGGLLRDLGPWLGGYRPDPGPASTGFAWVTGEPFVYTDWASGEPSNSNYDENNIQYLYKCASGASSCSVPLAPTWNDLSSGSDTYYHQLPVAYVVEFDSEPVPEPASLAFAVFGIAAIWLVHRGKRNGRVSL